MTDSKDIDFQKLLELENQNLQASWHKFPEEASLIDEMLSIYQSVPSSLNTYPREQIPILTMFWSCFCDFLISSRLILEAHVPESYAILSRSTEGVGYARKMSLNLDLIPIWIKKNELSNREFKDKFGEPFPKNDALLHPEIYTIYNLTSNYGRHQNMESTIFSSDFKSLNENKVYFNYSYIEDQVNLLRCINYVIYSYLKIILAFKVIFDGYLPSEWLEKLAAIESKFNKHIEELKIVFEKDVSK